MNAFSPSSEVTFTKSATVIQFDGSKDDSNSTNENALMIQHMAYTVKEMVGPWWKGGCFREIRKKVVLNDINMIFRSGHISAILGGSGSGKTSLLDVISYRRDGHVRGRILYNGRETSEDFMHRCSSYVMQADRLLPNLTVRETLVYTSRLRLPGHVRHWDILSRVQNVITEMGLKNVADSRIGGSVVRGVSGGEKRRVTIAIQLLQDPDILLLDEPTTGLDSYTASYLVKNLAEIAHRGKIVVITIHQPRSDLFKIFDQIVLLSEGKQVYSGPRDGMVQYFADLGFPCPTYVNPMDYFVDLTSIDRRNEQQEKQTRSKVCGFIESYGTSELHAKVEETFSSVQRKYNAWAGYDSIGPGITRKMTTLVSRMTLNLYRDKMAFVGRFVLLPIYFIFIIGFLGRLKDNQQSIQDRVGLLYQISSVSPYVAIVMSTAIFPSFRDVYYRESKDGLYGAGVFMISYVIHIMPYLVISVCIFGSGVYWICGLAPGVDRFFTMLAVLSLLYLSTEMANISLMGVFSNVQVASSLCVVLLAASAIIGSGFLRNIDDMLSGVQFTSWFFIHKYTSEILVVNEYDGLNFTCTNPAEEPCLFKNGKDYLDVYFPGAIAHMDRNFYITTGYTIFTVFLAMAIFKIRGAPTLR